MKTKNLKCIANALLIASFSAGPTLPAFADNYDDLCKNRAAQPTQANGGDANKAKSDITNSNCAAVDIARRSKKVHKAQAIVYTTTIAADVAAAIVANTPPYMQASVCKAFCAYSGYAITAESLWVDIDLAKKNGQDVNAVAMVAERVGSLALTHAPQLVSSLLSSSGEVVSKAATKATYSAAKAATKAGTSSVEQDQIMKAAGKKAAGGCVMAALGLGLPLANYVRAIPEDNKAEKQALDNLKTVELARKTTGYNYRKENNTSNGPEQSQRPDAITQKEDESGTCDNKSGNDHLKCLSTASPELAAIVNEPGRVEKLEQALGGKSLGDFIKNYNGEGTPADLAAYVANGMGMSADHVKSLVDTAIKHADDSGEKYTPMTYTSNSGQSAPVASTEPDMSKMMADMLKQLNPEDANSKDAVLQEMVFRKLDLLPPEKVEAIKEISIFARVGYRYRKKVNDLDHLNWSISANQASVAQPARSPANK